MAASKWWNRARELRRQPNMRGLSVTAEEWLQAADDLAATNARLLSLWGFPEAGSTGVAVCAAYIFDPGVLILALTVDAGATLPAIDGTFAAATRMQRALKDMCGVGSTGWDQRPWLRHAAWPETFVPLRDAEVNFEDRRHPVDTYEFVRVDGDGVHEIPVGPVHAGTIEPGHFRFSVVGEKVLRLEERLGYVHKGIERRFRELHALEAHKLAARVSGDSAVAFSWAYCQALEGLAGCEIPARAAWLRALCLELERIANHLGDLGALGNDAGFAFGLSQFLRVKETLLRTMDGAFGQRYLMDAIVPGGTSRDLSASGARAIGETITNVAREAAALREVYEEHEGLRDRFVDAGKLSPELAVRLGVIGLAARASGQPLDMRLDNPCPPYDALQPRRVVFSEGDVAARVNVRFEELQESCLLVQRLLDGLPGGAHAVEVALPPDGGFGAGLIESWRGPAFIALELGPAGQILGCHPHDPSWQNWPALEHAIIDNIVPDFPLINKSFNLSYSGHDL